MTTPPATAAPGAEVTPYAGDLAALHKQVRTQARLMLLPPTGGAVTVWACTSLHEQMMSALAVAGPEMLAIGVGGSVGVSTISAGVLLWTAVRTGTLEDLPRLDRGKSSVPAVKRLLLGAAGAGAALAVFGDHPLIVGGYVLAALTAAGRWQLQRMQAWWALRTARRSALAAAPVAAAATGPVVDAEVVASPPVAVPADVAQIVERWRVGVATRHLPDTWLTDGRTHEEGRMSFTVNSGPAGTTLSAAQAVLEKLPGALRLALPGPDGSGGQEIVFDQPTNGTLTDRSQLRMQIISQAAVTVRGRRFTPDPVWSPDNPGAGRIGGYVDDGGHGWWDFASDSGAHSGFVLAGTRMGKSSLFDGLAYRARQLGYLIGYLDPQRGASSPVLARHADFPVLGAEHTFAFLEWLEAEADLRESWMGAHGLGKMTPWTTAPCLPEGEHPDPGCPCGGVVPPGIMAFVDECDQAFRQLLPGSSTTRLGLRFGELAKRMNKLNMAIVAASQIPEQAIFGGSELLRSSLSTRNFLAMRVNAGTGANLIPGLPYSPSLLPRTPGRALMCGVDSRHMELQLDFMPRREDGARHPGPHAEDLFERLPRARAWAPTTATARRLLSGQGEDTARASLEAARARLARLMSAPAGPGNLDAGEPGPSGAAREAVAKAPQDTPGLITWPAPVRGGVAVAAPPAPPNPGGPAGLAEQLLRALAGVPDDQWLTRADLAKRLGRLAEDAEEPEAKVAGATLAADLAAEGVALPGRRRTAGMSATAGQIRAVLQ